MKNLTLKQFKDLTKDMPDDTVICVPYEHSSSSLKCTVNFMHISPVEHSHGKENTITLGQDVARWEKEQNSDLIVKKLVDKNTWDVINYKESE